MTDVVCFSHQGIRCAVPSRQVIAAGGKSVARTPVRLWDRMGDSTNAEAERVLDIATAAGPRPIEGSHVVLASLTEESIKPLPPLLRELLPLPHVVGVAALDGELIWLVDAKRFSP